MAIGFNLGKIEGLNPIEYPMLNVVVDGQQGIFEVRANSDAGIHWNGALTDPSGQSSQIDAELRIDSTGNIILVGYWDERFVGDEYNIEIYVNTITPEFAQGLRNAAIPYIITIPSELWDVIQSASLSHFPEMAQSQGVSAIHIDWTRSAAQNKEALDLMVAELKYITKHPEIQACVGSDELRVEYRYDDNDEGYIVETRKIEDGTDGINYFLWTRISASRSIDDHNYYDIHGVVFYQMITSYNT